jgi:hypothetical protein
MGLPPQAARTEGPPERGRAAWINRTKRIRSAGRITPPRGHVGAGWCRDDQPDGELDDTKQPLEADIPGWTRGCQGSGELQDGHRHPQHASKERDQNEPEVQRHRRTMPMPSSAMKPSSTTRKAISTTRLPLGSLSAWS